MNHQGDQTRQLNCNAIQNEVNPDLSIGALQRLNPSSSSLTTGSGERFPDNLSGPNINPPYQENANIVSHPGAQVIAFPRPSIHNPLDSNPSESSQEMDLSIIVGNSRTENEHSSVSTSDIHADGNSEPHFASLTFSSFEMRSTLAARVRAALEHLHAGGTQWLEEPMIHDYSSLLLHFLEALNIRRNEENVPNGGLVFEEEQNEDVDMGLTEEEIMTSIRHENFESVGEETPENKEVCSICQEDYVNGEEVGRLDCVHRFHVDCIKQWLVLKNICPICKRRALLPIDEDDDY